MTDHPYGALRLYDDLPAVRFERTYGTDPEDLWEAITDPARLERWFAVVEGELQPGGSFTLIFDDGSDPDRRTACTVIACEPPAHFEIAWSIPGDADSIMRVDLHAADGGGTTLVLDHRRLPTTSAAGHAAGWHCYVESLERHVHADATSSPTWDERWSELFPTYRDHLAAVTS